MAVAPTQRTAPASRRGHGAMVPRSLLGRDPAGDGPPPAQRYAPASRRGQPHPASAAYTRVAARKACPAPFDARHHAPREAFAAGGALGERTVAAKHHRPMVVAHGQHTTARTRHSAVLPTVLFFVRGERPGAIKLAGFCSDLQGFATKKAGFDPEASALEADACPNTGGSCGPKCKRRKRLCLRRLGLRRVARQYPRRDSNTKPSAPEADALSN